MRLALPIVGGHLRGRRWEVASGGKVVRVLTGRYEPQQTQLFERWIRPGSTVLDVGAHVGYYSLLASVLVGDDGAVWAFEPNPRNLAFLRRHVAVNGLNNVHVENAAVSDGEGVSRFAFGTGTGTGRLDGTGQLQVRTVTLDRFCEARQIRPAVVKIDVEGAEHRVLAGAASILGTLAPVIFLSTHGPEVHRRCLDTLRDHGYRLQPILGRDLDRTAEVLAVHGSSAAAG